MAGKSRTAYMREFMRRKRGTPPERFIGPRNPDPADSDAPRPSPSVRDPADLRPWLSRLRVLYQNLLRAQQARAAYQNDAMRLDLDPTPPAHILADLSAADAAYDQHAAEHPELAAEYVTRHEADQLRKDADRIALRLSRSPATPTPGTAARPRGRPRLTPAPDRAALAATEHAARTERDAAYHAYEDALANPPPGAREAGAIQTRWERAKARHERAADALAEHDRRTADAARAAEHAAAERAADEAALASFRHQVEQLLASLPDPPRAPLRAPQDTSNAARRADRQRRRNPQPVTAEALALLAHQYEPRHDTTTGERFLVRRGTGLRVRAATVTARGAPVVRTLDLLDALAPCGLV